MNPTHVHIELWAGESNHSRSVADVFDGDILTVTPIDGGVPRTYAPGVWVLATTYDADGYPIAEYRAKTLRLQAAW